MTETLDVAPRKQLLRLTRADMLVGLLLLVTVLVGAYFRFVGQNWDDFVRWHPDERFLSGVASSLGGPLSFTDAGIEEQYATCLARYPDTGGRGGFFDAQCSPMNPNNTGSGLYVYGTLPAFLVRWSADVVITLSGDPIWGTYTAVHLVGRFLSALADMGVILIVFAIGRRLHGKWVGLLAAMLYACAVFPIQQSHFWTADAISNLFVALAIWGAVRVQLSGRLGSYIEFGLYFGMALASRINTAPLVGLLLLAVALRLLPLLDSRMAWGERQQILTRAIMGLALAGGATLLAFRILNPYAFTGPSFFGVLPNPRWLEDVGQAQHLVSGNAESPPNWQWAGRTRYLFPFANMNLWGMGILLGVTAWAAWTWSVWRILRGRQGALRNLLLVAWIAVYFGWLGNLWVMSMRYYLPMYPVFAVLAAWALVELVQRAVQTPVTWRRATAWGVLAVVTGFTALWALMFTSIYREMHTTAQSSHWVWENIPADFSMKIDGADAPLVNIAVINRFGGDETPLDLQATQYETGQPYRQRFTVPADGVIRSVHSPHLGDPGSDADVETVRVQITQPDTSVVMAEGVLTADLDRDEHILGSAYDIVLAQPLSVRAGESYDFVVAVLEGGPVISAGAVFTWEGDWDEVSLPKVCALPSGVTLADSPPPGLAGPRECQGRDLWSTAINGYKLQVYYDETPYKRDIFQRALDNTEYLIISTNRRYDSQSRIPYRWPMTMRYYDALFSGELGFELVQTFESTFELGSLKVSDQYLPTYNAPEWLNEFEAEEAFHVYDHPTVFIFRKTAGYSSERTSTLLNSVTLNQIEAAQQYNACPNVQPGSPIGYYCDDMLVDVVPLYSIPASSVPTLLQFPPDVAQTQYAGGTWSERFFSQSIVNTQPAVTILVWWLAIMVFGWAAWPLLFVLFPGLADRGYSFAKAAGLVLVAWLTWFVSSARVPMWSQSGVLLALVIITGVGLLLVWRRSADFLAFLRANVRRMLWIEALTLLGFVAFLVVRLGNPDLWHPSFGGEKPMDFAYFNGVLRSTVFPPIDPWHAGGFINYYYFGFVIVGSPVLLLGIMPSIAYNLILPTLFTLAGMGAFSVAFNVVSALRERAAVKVSKPEPDLPASDGFGADADERQPRVVDAEPVESPPTRLGNPWVAGIAAFMLAVVLGNLDTPRIFISEGLMSTGGYNQAFILQDQLIREYTEANGEAPTGEALTAIIDRASADAASPLQSAIRGLQRVLRGDPLNLAPNRWYWAATRVIAESSGGTDAAIAEFPFFTFLYGDLHAHMIAMPMMFLAMVFVLNEVLLAGRDNRRWLAGLLAMAFGAGVIGLLRATNTWDWITFMLLGVLGLSYAWSLTLKPSSAQDRVGDWRWRQDVTHLLGRLGLTRRALLVLIGRVLLFVTLSFLLALPYATWYSAVYNRALPWQGPRTPMWAYLTIHGMFLFLVVSLLLWDTGRWLRSVYVRSLRGQCGVLLALGLALLMMVLGAAVLSLSVPVTIIAVPLLLWVTVLFFRQGQTREMRYVLALTGLALGLTLGVEYVVLDGDIGRQNTLFKFYIQAWLLFSAVGGAAVAWLLHGAMRWPGWVRAPWYALAGLLVTAAALYPIMASRGRALDRMLPQPPLTMGEVPPSLDGSYYMQYAWHYEGDSALIQNDPSLSPFPLADDYNLIRWLQENVQGTPTIMEGRADREYRWEARIAINTGLPAVIGWNFHQRQQRTFDPLPRLVQQRVANVNAFYTTTETDTAWNILRHYNVSYVVVGNLEHAYYPAEGLAKFARMVEEGRLLPVYQINKSVIYQVNRDAGFNLVEDVAGGV
jgi:YYY domain-containing protein